MCAFTGEFPIFNASFDAILWGFDESLSFYKGPLGDGAYYGISHRYSATMAGMVRWRRMLPILPRFSSFTKTDRGQGFDVIFNYVGGWEPKRLGWDLVMCALRDATDRYTSSHMS